MSRPRKITKKLLPTIVSASLLAGSAILLPVVVPGLAASNAAAAAPARALALTVSPTSKVPGKKVSAAKRHTELLRAQMIRLEKAGGGTLTLAPGTYRMSNVVYVPSNVTVRLSAGTKLVKTAGSKAIFHLIRPSKATKAKAVGGHQGEANISIVGAGVGQSTIDLAGREGAMGIVMGHNRNVTVSGISFRNMRNGHFIEMDASANVVVSGNEFRTAVKGTKLAKEAINLDTPDLVNKGFSAKWSKFDGTPNSGVLIEGNTFADLTRAIGTHNFTKDRYHQNVTVRGNTMRNHRSDPIRPLNWSDAVVTGNLIDGVPSGNLFGIRAAGVLNPTFSGNTFRNLGQAITVIPHSNSSAAKYKVQGTARSSLSAANLAALADNVAGPEVRDAQASVDSRSFTADMSAFQVGAGGPARIWFTGFRPTTPAVPSGVTATPVSGGVRLSWDAPVTSGLSRANSYQVAVYSDAACTRPAKVKYPTLPANSAAFDVTGAGRTGTPSTITLPAGTYWVTVKATNAAEGSAPSAAVQVTVG